MLKGPYQYPAMKEVEEANQFEILRTENQEISYDSVNHEEV
jgi:hypothetical protein